MMTTRTYLLAIAFSLISIGAYTQCGPLTTIYAGNNGQDGIMFDITALNSVVITNFDIDAYGNTHDYEIYYRPGTHVGFQNSAVGWTLAGTALGVPGNPRNSPTAIPITLNLPMCAGDTYGFYITSTSTSGSISYTNGTATGAVFVADANIQIKEGTGKDYPFNFSYNPRVPNMTCYYTCAMSCCLPPTMASTSTTCAGACDGTATGTVGAGGIPPYTYLWDPSTGGQTTQTATGLCAGTYTLDVTDATGCVASGTVTVTDGAAGADATITPAGPFCLGDAATNLTAVDPGGTWSGTGITNAALGTFDPGTAGVGTWTITYTIAGVCGDVQTTNITVNPSQDATITPVGPFCTSDPALNLNAVDPGGTWSGTGITNAVMGTFDPATAGAGTWTITYSIPGACGDVQTTNITVNAQLDATITPAGPFCESDAATNLSAVDPGGTWSGTGITNVALGTFDPATAGAGTWTITYNIPGACGDLQTTNITVNADADATISPVGPFCPGDPAVNCTGADPGGTWSGTGITNAALGTFDPATAGPGTWTITYSIGGTCPDVQTYNVLVNSSFDATITPAGPFCESDVATNLSAVDVGGTWSGTGITNPVNGTFDPMTATSGTWTITYTIAGSCGSTDTENITVNADADATITPAGPFCLGDLPVNMMGADPGGTWSGTGITDPVNGTFDPATAGAGTWTITYDITGACPDLQTYDVVVNNSFDATITPAGPFCESNTSTNLSAVDPGGTWSGAGITDPVNGTFDPATAGAGTWTITYDIPGACGSSDTENIQVIPDDDATITPSGPFCDSDPALNLSAVDAGGTWSGTGITDPALGTFDPATAGAGSWTITYDIPGACGDTDTETIVVSSQLDATITPVGPYCESDPSVTLTAVDAGGTWSGTGITNPANGTFDPATATAGTWTITYTLAGACGDVQTYDIVVNPDMNATITPAGPYCVGEPLVNLSAVDPGGTWSGTGIIDPVNGTFDPGTAGVGVWVITYDIPGPCGDTKTMPITVVPNFDATVTPVGSYCEDAAAVNLSAVDPGGTWSGTGITDPVNGTFDPATAGAGTWTITYDIPGACGDVQTIDILVNPLPAVTFVTDITSGCEPIDVTFTNTTAGFSSCSWDFGSAGSSTTCGTVTTTFPTGTYDISLTVTDVNGCTNSTTMPGLINSYAIPVAEFYYNPQPTTIMNSTINFTNASTDGATYSWDFGGMGSSVNSNPAYTFPDVGTYDVTLTVTSANGCTDEVTHPIVIGEEFIIYVPNAFTPDLDGVNDVFTPVLSGIEVNDYTLYIFNRWGERIFESQTPSEGWDGSYQGELVQEDVYVWKILARGSATAKQYNYTGHVTVVR